ncbi:LacI family transcriptional regulator [Photobacterium makurazakiensis]|uniref:LacI family DNA-binding transcriptional regulator n=1 Tax=Photobacterium makurazakiensis TaxID=2910234 RepID=UPI003D14090C
MDTQAVMTASDKRFVSAQQVADLAGVSRSAVSRTFTEGASVSPKTREKVMAAAKQLGYHVNHLARGLHDTSNIVSLITTDISTPFQASFIDTLTRQLQQINKVAMVINTKGDKNSVTAALNQTLNFRAEASIILSGQPPKELIDKCITNGQRVILVNRHDAHPNADNIRLDNFTAAQQALHILVEQGCQHVAVVNSNIGSSGLMAREQGFIAAANKAGLRVDVIRHGDTSYQSGSHMAGQLQNQPDGVFCVTDLLACGFVDGLKKRNIHIPDDMVVIGFDDIEQASWSSYQLTTFKQPITQITEHIIGRLQAATSASKSDYLYTLEPILRATTR